jgi:hypothetical protein
MESLEGTLRGKTFTTPTTSTIKDSSSPPAEVAGILRIEGIESVYAMATALTINKRVSAKWEHILPLVLTALVGSSSEEQQSLLLQDVAALLESNNNNNEELQTRVGGQVRMRLQVSHRIPIQIEATGFLGTTKRAKASSPKFSQSMDDLLLKEDVNGGRIDFFAGRTWVDRGVRYLDERTDDDDSIVSEQDQERSEMDRVLEAELEELNAAYSADRLAAIVADSLHIVGEKEQQPSSTSASGVMVVDVDVEDLDLQKVDHYCDLAEQGDMEALSVLAKFVSSHKGLMAARRNALAYLGGTGDIAAAATRAQGSAYDYAALVLDAVVSALQNEKNPTMRRTAGDALSDLGDVRAVPPATTALSEDRSKLVQWRTARILGELGASLEVVGDLKQASFSDKYAFEVAFEIKDALRKVKARIQNQDNGIANGEPNTGTGPVWKQIQQGMDSS